MSSITTMTLESPLPTPPATRPEADPRRALRIRAQDGDVAAFETLLRRHERRVLSVAWRLLGRLEDAQDAAQEVFLRLYRHLGRLDPARPLAPWLYRVTVNVCRDLGRRRRPELTLEDGPGELIDDDRAADPAAAVEQAGARRFLARALATLSAKERTAIVLRDLEGLSTAEVAAAMAVSPVTVRTHVCRGRLKIKAFHDREQETRR